MPILDELKKQANGKADSANNIAEAIALMNFSEGGVTPEEIAESVSAYLDEHLTNPTNPPIEIQLSANQINSLYGVNNLWADSGDTEVEYRADTKAWIQRKIAEAISALS